MTIGGDIITKGKLTIGKDFFKLKTNLSNSILIADGQKFKPVLMTGDLSIFSSGATSINDQKIFNKHINDDALINYTKTTLRDGSYCTIRPYGNLHKIDIDDVFLQKGGNWNTQDIGINNYDNIDKVIIKQFLNIFS